MFVNNYKKVIKNIIIVAIWLVIWQIASVLTGLELLLAGPVTVFLSLVKLAGTAKYYVVILNSMLHIMAGLSVAFLSGCILGGLAGKNSLVRDFLNPAVSVMKTLPVASFIIILLIWFGSKSIAAFISFIVMFPFVYSSVVKGVNSVDEKIIQMAKVFKIPVLRQSRCIYLRAVVPFLENGLSVAVGMCFKAGVSAEVIGLTADSVGEQLYFSKLYLDTAELFAWSLSIVIAGLLMEKMVIFLLKASEKAISGLY